MVVCSEATYIHARQRFGLRMASINLPGVSHCYADLNGNKYHYLLGTPTSGSYRATVFLIHGWPDLAIGWRYQIPSLLRLNLRVVAPDLLGFGGSDAPKVPPNSLALYSQKRVSDDIAELARQLGAKQIILGGHDWGGAIVYRCALWHPELVTHVFAVCTPYTPPTKRFVSLDMVVERAPQFGYQKQLAGPDVEATVKSKEHIQHFLDGMYGGRSPDRKTLFTAKHGIDFEVLPRIGHSKLLTNQEIEYYSEQYARNGLHGTLNWYRTREINWREELELKTEQIDVPVLFVQATNDDVLLPSLSRGMEKHIPLLTRREVAAGHWAMWQKPDEVNDFLEKWITDVALGSKSRL